MRKAANILAIISTAFVLLAVVLTLTGLPGRSLLFLVFVSVFNLVALPLNLAWQMKQNKAGIKRTANIAGMIGIWMVLFVMVYKALSWDGGMIVLITGGLTMLAFGVLFIVSSKRSDVITTWISPITIMTVVIFVCLSIGWANAYSRDKFAGEHIANYRTERENYEQVLQETDDRFVAFVNDAGVSDSEHVAAKKLFDRAKELIVYIAGTSREFVGRVNGEDIPATGDPAMYLYDYSETDVTTYYFIGESPQTPTGKGMDIYYKLADFRENYLHQDVRFFIPLSSTTEDQEQWVKDNFYHTASIDALLHLTLAEENILRAVQEAMEKELFVQ